MVGSTLKVGDYVVKDSGDYYYSGNIVAIFHKHKRRDILRFVVENNDGMLFIFNERQLKKVNETI